MAWIYLAESEESQKRSKGIPIPSLIVKTTDMLKLCYCRGWLAEIYQMPPSGMTFVHSEQNCYLLNPTLSTVASPAKTLAVPVAERAWRESEAAYSSRSLGCVAKYDLDSSSWRTSQLSLFEAQSELLESFAAYGMTVDGEFYPLRMWERIIREKGGGFWPTPTASDGSCGNVLNDQTEIYFLKSGRPRKISKQGVDGSVGLARMVKIWRTPTATEGQRGIGKTMRLMSEGKSHDENGRQIQVSLDAQVGGSLNPTWVEWLMGYPSAWIVLEPWATAWFRPKRGKRLSA